MKNACGRLTILYYFLLLSPPSFPTIIITTDQFCGNDPDTLLAAARYVEPYVDAIDINLGCPQVGR